MWHIEMPKKSISLVNIHFCWLVFYVFNGSQVGRAAIKCLHRVGENLFFLVCEWHIHLHTIEKITLSESHEKTKKPRKKSYFFSSNFQKNWEIANFQKMGPSSRNIHFCWVDVLCIFHMDLWITEIPLKVGIEWENWFFYFFIRLSLYHTSF